MVALIKAINSTAHEHTKSFDKVTRRTFKTPMNSPSQIRCRVNVAGVPEKMAAEA